MTHEGVDQLNTQNKGGIPKTRADRGKLLLSVYRATQPLETPTLPALLLAHLLPHVHAHGGPL
jgi:hypothetical protein